MAGGARIWTGTPNKVLPLPPAAGTTRCERINARANPGGQEAAGSMGSGKPPGQLRKWPTPARLARSAIGASATTFGQHAGCAMLALSPIPLRVVAGVPGRSKIVVFGVMLRAYMAAAPMMGDVLAAHRAACRSPRGRPPSGCCDDRGRLPDDLDRLPSDLPMRRAHRQTVDAACPSASPLPGSRRSK